MPVRPNPERITAWPHQANVPVRDNAKVTVSLQLQNDGRATPEEMDAALQDLVDHLQDWPGRRPGGNVTGSKYETLLYTVTPTRPAPDPDPPVPEPPPRP